MLLYLDANKKEQQSFEKKIFGKRNIVAPLNIFFIWPALS